MSLPTAPRCSACKEGNVLPFDFTMAFQPIVDVDRRSIYAYEALVRGPEGQGAGFVLGQVTEENRYAFDQRCRVRAIQLASRLNLAASGALLSINFMPGAVYSPRACLQLTLRTAEELGFPCDRLIFEVTEQEQLVDPAHLRAIVHEYRRHGFKIAIDDLGAGYSGLNLLADLPSDVLKLDMQLTRNLHERPRAIEIVRNMVRLATGLNSQLIAEGVETEEEFHAIRDCGVTLMQGYLFARPAFESLPEAEIPGFAPILAPMYKHETAAAPIVLD
jgi:EAL domain-containing protein (putative c-di-GMP-specific phosphodiesterase class I)